MNIVSELVEWILNKVWFFGSNNWDLTLTYIFCNVKQGGENVLLTSCCVTYGKNIRIYIYIYIYFFPKHDFALDALGEFIQHLSL